MKINLKFSVVMYKIVQRSLNQLIRNLGYLFLGPGSLLILIIALVPLNQSLRFCHVIYFEFF